ncbi:hypothetical protein PsorP6_014947 [Peronosclerospora sorghi]|uniref:Uncharacterized protein n=1 Tax=Peronosclerospora sorghi TaxID=230839 RepID=A0ACC0VT84_9STRA|nr:hypothetical protein PsorP6_014947 [Peronosclerospora sorghi]
MESSLVPSSTGAMMDPRDSTIFESVVSQWIHLVSMRCRLVLAGFVATSFVCAVQTSSARLGSIQGPTDATRVHRVLRSDSEDDVEEDRRVSCWPTMEDVKFLISKPRRARPKVEKPAKDAAGKTVDAANQLEKGTAAGDRVADPAKKDLADPLKKVVQDHLKQMPQENQGQFVNLVQTRAQRGGDKADVIDKHVLGAKEGIAKLKQYE